MSAPVSDDCYWRPSSLNEFHLPGGVVMIGGPDSLELPEHAHDFIQVSSGFRAARGLKQARQHSPGWLTKPATLRVIPAGMHHRGGWARGTQVVVLHFFRPLIESIADELSVRGKFDFCSTTTGTDRFGMELLGSIGREVRSQTLFSRVYLESLFRVFAGHMTRTYSDAQYARATNFGGLSPRQLRAVDDFIHAHLNQNVGLSALAVAAGIGPQRFLTAFRNSTNQTPHQYILARRIHVARRLLAAEKMSIAEIAFELGFSSQSHFGAVFRRVVGASPRYYRDTLRVRSNI